MLQNPLRLAMFLLVLLTIPIPGTGQESLRAPHPRIYIPHTASLFGSAPNDLYDASKFTVDLSQWDEFGRPRRPHGRPAKPEGTVIPASFTAPIEAPDKQELKHRIDARQTTVPPVAVIPEVTLDADWHPVEGSKIDRALLETLKRAIGASRQEFADAKQLETDEAKALTRAAKWLVKAEEWRSRTDNYIQETTAAPRKTAEAEAKLNADVPPPIKALDTKIKIEQYAAQLQEKQQTQQELRVLLNQAEESVQNRSQQPAEIEKRKSVAQKKLAEAQAAIKGPAENGNSMATPMRLEQQAMAVAMAIELELCDVQQQWLIATDTLESLERDVVKRQLDHLNISVQQLEKLIDDRRSQLAQQEAQKARREAANAHPKVRDLAVENAKLAEEFNQIAKELKTISAEQQQLDELLQSLNDVRKKLENHVQVAGHTQAVGLMLRHERVELPATSESVQRIAQIKAKLPALSFKQLEFKEQRDAFVDKQTALLNEFEASGDQALAPTRRDLKKMVNEVLAKQRGYLDQLNGDYGAYLTDLSKLEVTHRQLITKTNELKLFIDKHVLWIRSAEPIDSSDARQALHAIQSIVSSEQWRDVLTWLKSRLTMNWPMILMIGIGLWLVIGMRNQLDRRLRAVSRRRSELRFSPIMRSLFLTVLQASFFPALVATLGWLLQAPYEPGSLKDSLSHGLLMVAPQLLVASILFRFAIRGGLAETQLKWSPSVTNSLRIAIGGIVRHCLPLMLLTYSLEVFKDGRWSDSLGRIAFVVGMVAFSLSVFRGLRGIRKSWRRHQSRATVFWVQSSGLWSAVVTIGPLALACFAGLGFLYSSVFLATRLLLSWWLVLGCIAGFFLVSRLVDIGQNILVARRRWPIDRVARENPTPDLDDDQREFDSLRRQVHSLLRVATIATCVIVGYSLWAEALPAMQAFDYGLWSISQQVEMEGPDGQTVLQDQLGWITVGDILRSFLIIAATIFLSRNLPGLLEMIILNRLPIDRGGRYAISIVSRYLVGAIGILLAFRSVGFTWSSVQWLVAAMSVGLGFGLQEIFANFISGIIILLERPIRVGDLVTVNDTTGFVTKVQLRATMIMDYDRRELIVPNKKFITDDVINWTLTDSVTRVVVPVGIAYGSDTHRAQEVLVKVAREHPLVLNEPASSVIFTRFGSSSLDFELRVHIPDRENYHEVVHQLHMAVDREFRKANIEIAFPQQDLHVRSIDANLFPARESRPAAGVEQESQAPQRKAG